MAEWKLNYNNHSWTENDITGDDLASLAILLGDSWDMTPIKGPLHLLMFISVLEARTSGRSIEEVGEELRTMRAVDLLGAIEITE